MADVKRVYTFGNKEAEGNGKMRELLGGKGANLAEMNLIGIPVPPGFTITTEVCSEYYAQGREKVVGLLRPEVEKAMKNIEKLTGMKFGDKEMPLLVSVRSGARASMPGMMDTILNLGLNETVVEVIAIAVRIAAPQGGDDGHPQHHAYQHGQDDQKRPQALAAAALLLPGSFGRRGSGHGARLHIAARGRSRRIGRQRHFIFIIHIQSTSRGAPCAICMVKVKAVTPS